jgi:hypothetical protein
MGEKNMKTLEIKNCITCPYSKTMRGNYSNWTECSKTGHKVDKIIPDDCPLQDNKSSFVAYTFHIKSEDIKYYTDKRIPYDKWKELIQTIKEYKDIDSLTIWDCFEKTTNECDIKVVFPVCEEYYTF